MFAKQRQQQIVEEVNGNGSVKVKELAIKFKVTEDSIRKDLTILEKRGLLKKTYGGAMTVRTLTHNFGVDTRRNRNSSEKKEIARKSVELINEGDTIFLDISTIAIEIANLLVEKQLKITVVTNMLDVLNVVSKSSVMEIIFIGGSLNRTRDGFIGGHAIAQINTFRFDTCFLGSVGVDLDSDIVYTYKVDDGLTKSAILHASKQSYIVLEKEKFTHDGTYKYCALADCSGIITSNNLDNITRSKINDIGIKIV